MNYEAIIGLEVHAQLATQSKMFCRCATAFGDPPNSNICPVCTAQPGALPVLNERAVEMAIRAGIALDCSIQERSIFARKNYFYPDLTKGYQISQYEFPLCLGGRLGSVTIERIHLEEDAGKLTHDFGHPDKSHIDFNRCGVPLIEIVSGPDLRSPEEAADYLRKLHQILVYLEVCRGNMQEGNLRCDANISIRKRGAKEFGIRTETKNLNSFKMVERCLQYEIRRQTELLESGGAVVQETRLWNDELGRTEPMRSKEEAHDYRYFPDPDLLPLIVPANWVTRVREQLPELPDTKARRFVEMHGLPEYDAQVLTAEKALANYFERAAESPNAPKKIANWIMTELLRALNDEGISIERCRLQATQLAQLVKLIDDGTISGKMGKEIFEEMYRTGCDAEKVIEAKGLKLVSDEGELEKVIDRVIAENPAQAEQYRSGKEKLFGFFVGQTMKATKGQANPSVVNELLKKKLAAKQ